MAEILTLDGQQLSDDWIVLADDAAATGHSHIIVSLQRWQTEHAALKAGGSAVGVQLDNTLDVLSLPESVLQADLIALNFPAFTDGRAYSQARLLRERLQYSGPIRACGDVLHDQLFYMARCGFDQFQRPQNLDDADLKKALATFSIAYQPTRSGPQVGDAGILKSAR